MVGVPHEELVLAEMIAACEAHGLGFVSGHTGVELEEGVVVPVGDCCCAIGAYTVFKPATTAEIQDGADFDVRVEYDVFRRLTGLSTTEVFTGNDDLVGDKTAVSCGPAYDVGAAYRAYHLDNEDKTITA